MRLLHTSDWHLGRTLHGQDLGEAHDVFFTHLLDVVKTEKVDAVIVAGDVYDRGFPPVDAVERLDEWLWRLSELTQVVLLSGNHDSARRLSFGTRMWHQNVTMRTKTVDIDKPIEITDDDGGMARIFAIPYLEPDLVRYDFATSDNDGGPANPLPRSHEAVISAAMQRINQKISQLDTKAVNIVVAHAFVTGGISSDSEREIKVGGVDQVSAASLSGENLAYVALGHLHAPQKVSAQVPMRYSGSPLAFSFSEAGQVKSMRLLDFSQGQLNTEEVIEIPQLRALSEITAPIFDIETGIFADQEQDYVKVTVTDNIRPEHLNERIKNLFPHALSIIHQPQRQQTVTGVSSKTVKTDPTQVLRDFVSQIDGTTPSQEEIDILQDIWEQANREAE